MFNYRHFTSSKSDARRGLIAKARRVLHGILLGAGLSLSFISNAQPIETEPTDLSLEHSVHPGWDKQAYSLRSMGITLRPATPGSDSYQEVYFPVPAAVALDDIVLKFKARYLMDEAGALLQLLVDGQPVMIRSFSDKEGSVEVAIPLELQSSNSGFVRLGINWFSNHDLQACQVTPASLSTLSISDETGISYRYRTALPFSLKSAWGALPPDPLLLVGDEQSSAAAFDAAWRIATVLERAGKRVKVGQFPKIGDVIDTKGIRIPDAMRQTSVFDAIRRAQSGFEIGTEADIGALILLDAQAATGNIVIIDESLRRKMGSALDALAEALAPDVAATAAMDAWRERSALTGGEALNADLWVEISGSRPIIAVRAQAGPQAAGLLSDTWRQILTSSRVRVEAASRPDFTNENQIRLSSLGASFRSFQVSNQGHWTSEFALGAVSPNGQMPTRFALDLAIAPDSSGTSPVVSVLLNDTLLTAAQLRADGEKQRISARIPGYALRLSNELRVEVQRLPVASGCAQSVRGYPVSVLPTSYLEIGKAEPDGTFIGLLPSLASSPDLIVPDTWAGQGNARIMQIARLAVATGLSATHTKLVSVPEGKPVQPQTAFIAMNVPVEGVESKVGVTQSGKIAVAKRGVTWLDITGLDGITAIEVAESGGHRGLIWQSHGESLDTPSPAYVLDRGDVTLIGPQGPVAWIDSAHPDSSRIADAANSAFYEWRHYLSWGVPLISAIVLFFVVLLALAYKAGRRREKK